MRRGIWKKSRWKFFIRIERKSLVLADDQQAAWLRSPRATESRRNDFGAVRSINDRFAYTSWQIDPASVSAPLRDLYALRIGRSPQRKYKWHATNISIGRSTVYLRRVISFTFVKWISTWPTNNGLDRRMLFPFGTSLLKNHAHFVSD